MFGDSSRSVTIGRIRVEYEVVSPWCQRFNIWPWVTPTERPDTNWVVCYRPTATSAPTDSSGETYSVKTTKESEQPFWNHSKEWAKRAVVEGRILEIAAWDLIQLLFTRRCFLSYKYICILALVRKAIVRSIRKPVDSFSFCFLSPLPVAYVVSSEFHFYRWFYELCIGPMSPSWLTWCQESINRYSDSEAVSWSRHCVLFLRSLSCHDIRLSIVKNFNDWTALRLRSQ